MVRLKMNREEFAYDCISLIKAFYPKEKILLHGDDEGVTTEIVLDRFLEGNVHEIRMTLSEEQTTRKSRFVTIEGDENSLENKRLLRMAYKDLIYEVLSEAKQETLPWGTLTGVRPTKLPYSWYQEGMTETEAVNRLMTEYRVSPEKAQTAAQIAMTERELFAGIDVSKEISIYIGIPFCPTTCLYCSFTSYPIAEYQNLTEAYLSCLFREIQAVSQMTKGRKVTAIYIGGGTPTSLTADQLRRLLHTVRENFDLKTVREFTVEAGRPDSVDFEKLLVLKEEGVTRISINPQTMKQETLDLIGRRHSVEDVRRAFALAREAGHDNINMDLILGLPGENADDVSATLSEIATLSPEDLTVHTLALKRASRLVREIDRYEDLTPTDTVESLQRTITFAKEHGYRPYYLYRQKNMAENLENVGYAKPGHEGLYNILIMEEMQTILACGAGATSKFVYPEQNRIERADNVKSIRDYIERIDEMIDRKRRMPLGG
ncbi:MAG: coproporphyrinogen dehydrogenase HemZ [Lachnospiraceae bacterium]|nr:coproporphyrinogen dehydrogenase HemZ [Lachnospiraceae bacterium]